MGILPFLRPGGAGDIVAWARSGPISRAQFLADVAQLAERLPARPYVLNDCEERYAFVLAFAAAMQRGQISLFPSNRSEHAVQRLRQTHPGLYRISDRPQAVRGDDVIVGGAEPAAALPSQVSEPAFPADQVAALAFTSGSTGESKVHRKTWGWFVGEARAGAEALGMEAGISGVVATTPPQHMYGFIASVMLPLQQGWALGSAVPFYPADIDAALAERNMPCLLVTTPLQLRTCLEREARLPNLAGILTSAAPLARTLAARAEDIYRVPVMEFYGSTETGAMAVRRTVRKDVWRTFPGVEVSSIENELVVRSAYFEGAIRVSDHVEVLSGAEFRLLGRSADLVKVAGKRISLGELNRVLLDISGVEDGCFFLPECVGAAEGDRRLVAFAVAPGRSKESLRAALRERIDPVFLPRPLHLIEALPRTATGKLPRADLQVLFDSLVNRPARGGALS